MAKNRDNPTSRNETANATNWEREEAIRNIWRWFEIGQLSIARREKGGATKEAMDKEIADTMGLRSAVSVKQARRFVEAYSKPELEALIVMPSESGFVLTYSHLCVLNSMEDKQQRKAILEQAHRQTMSHPEFKKFVEKSRNGEAPSKHAVPGAGRPIKVPDEIQEVLSELCDRSRKWIKFTEVIGGNRPESPLSQLSKLPALKFNINQLNSIAEAREVMILVEKAASQAEAILAKAEATLKENQSKAKAATGSRKTRPRVLGLKPAQDSPPVAEPYANTPTCPPAGPPKRTRPRSDGAEKTPPSESSENDLGTSEGKAKPSKKPDRRRK